MRIISGNFKGKKILQPKDKTTRPLKDLTKESIFNIILHSNKFNINIKNSNILDLFAGVGSFGIECLSRGSSSLTFIENYKEALLILKRNISNLNCQNISLIIEKNISNNFNFKIFEKKFDIIFMDPPYKDSDINDLLENIFNQKILNENGILIIHRHKDEKDLIPNKLKVIEEKKYGLSKIIFLSILN